MPNMNVKLSSADIDKIKAQAALEAVSMSVIFRRYLKKGMEWYERQAEIMKKQGGGQL
jgi:hypothetical protein